LPGAGTTPLSRDAEPARKLAKLVKVQTTFSEIGFQLLFRRRSTENPTRIECAPLVHRMSSPIA
jgi:hypothetical protein